MKNLRLFVVSGLLVIAGSAYGQAPAGAPAGATGICKDGTYSTAASKAGACTGHKGVQTWYSAAAPAAASMHASKPAATVPSKPAPTPAPAASAPAMPAPAATSAKGPAAAAATKTAAAGGGPNLVWVNTESKVYHCYGTTYYGKTKAGAYMSESDAKAKGAHADHGQACSK